MPDDQTAIIVNDTINQNQSHNINIDIETRVPIPFISDKITGNKIVKLNGKIEVEIRIEDKIFKKELDNETQFIEKMTEINRYSDDITQEKLYDLNFRAQWVGLVKVIWKYRKNLGLKSFFSFLSLIGTLCLMTKNEQLLIEGDGDGLWSAKQAILFGIGPRIFGAVASLPAQVSSLWAKENEFAIEKPQYNKWQVGNAGADLILMGSTMVETAAFNIGNLKKEDIFRLAAIFESLDNFKKVFWNDFSRWFTIEQCVRLIKNFISIVHHTTEFIPPKKFNKIILIANYSSNGLVAGGFWNVIFGIINYNGQNPGHGIEILPTNSKIKSTIGIASAGAEASFNVVVLSISITAGLNICDRISKLLHNQSINSKSQLSPLSPAINCDENQPIFHGESLRILQDEPSRRLQDAAVNIVNTVVNIETTAENLEHNESFKNFTNSDEFLSPPLTLVEKQEIKESPVATTSEDLISFEEECELHYENFDQNTPMILQSNNSEIQNQSIPKEIEATETETKQIEEIPTFTN